MSLAVGVVSSSKSMGFGDSKDGEESTEVSDTKTTAKTAANEASVDEPSEKFDRQMSESSIYATEEEEEEDVEGKIQLGPQCTLKEQLEKDKDDESLRRWKEQLLGSVDINSVGETLEPDVKILSLAIRSPGRPDIVLPIPETGKPKGLWFTLKEGSRYSLKFTFQVSNNIVSGLKYANTVWKTGIKAFPTPFLHSFRDPNRGLVKEIRLLNPRIGCSPSYESLHTVDSTKEMLGTFSPQPEPYTHEMPEETTPSGIFARGSYSAKSRFVDDDNKCYLEINYMFDIRKDWQST